MKLHALIAPVVALAMMGCATAREPRPEEVAELKVIEADATMPFASLRVQDWVGREDGSLLIRGTNHRWYHATLSGNCPWLNTATKIAFKSTQGHLDKYSSIVVEGNTCLFDTFDEVADPRPGKTA